MRYIPKIFELAGRVYEVITETVKPNVLVKISTGPCDSLSIPALDFEDALRLIVNHARAMRRIDEGELHSFLSQIGRRLDDLNVSAKSNDASSSDSLKICVDCQFYRLACECICLATEAAKVDVVTGKKSYTTCSEMRKSLSCGTGAKLFKKIGEVSEMWGC